MRRPQYSLEQCELCHASHLLASSNRPAATTSPKQTINQIMTWVYLPVLNKLIQIIATILIGYCSEAFGIIQASLFVPQSVTVVFKILLPSLIIKGVGIGIDFYAEKNIWAFIVACELNRMRKTRSSCTSFDSCMSTQLEFSIACTVLILRAMALIIAFCTVLFLNWKAKRPTKGLGDIAVLWLSFTWISTVILGVPICSAIFGNPSLGVLYGLMAGVSSFIFQLPLQLIFFEYHVAEQRWAREMLHSIQPSVSAPMKDSTVITMEAEATSDQSSHPDEEPLDDLRSWWSIVNFVHLSQAVVWLDIGKRLLANPILIALFVGFVLSLSTAGQYLRCPSDTCIAGLEWIGSTLGWLGECVSPLSLLAMGSWMHGQLYPSSSQRTPILKLCFFMIIKQIVVPLLMVGLAKGMQLNDEAGRAAILISALPISMASFSLGHQYSIGEKDLAANVTAGTVLMLPTIIVWNLVLDAVGLYPLQ